MRRGVKPIGEEPALPRSPQTENALLRSGLAQGPVGKKTWLHPVVAMAALYRDPIEAFYGAPQSVASHHFAHRPEGAGFFIEAAPVHPMLSSIAMPGFGAPLQTRMGLLPNVCATIALMIDGFDPSHVLELRLLDT